MLLMDSTFKTTATTAEDETMNDENKAEIKKQIMEAATDIAEASAVMRKPSEAKLGMLSFFLDEILEHC